MRLGRNYSGKFWNSKYFCFFYISFLEYQIIQFFHVFIVSYDFVHLKESDTLFNLKLLIKKYKIMETQLSIEKLHQMMDFTDRFDTLPIEIYATRRIVDLIEQKSLEVIHNDSFLDKDRDLLRPQIIVKIPLNYDYMIMQFLRYFWTNNNYYYRFKPSEYTYMELEISFNIKYSEYLEIWNKFVLS